MDLEALVLDPKGPGVNQEALVLDLEAQEWSWRPWSGPEDPGAGP